MWKTWEGRVFELPGRNSNPGGAGLKRRSNSLRNWTVASRPAGCGERLSGPAEFRRCVVVGARPPYSTVTGANPWVLRVLGSHILIKDTGCTQLPGTHQASMDLPHQRMRHETHHSHCTYANMIPKYYRALSRKFLELSVLKCYSTDTNKITGSSKRPFLGEG